MDNKTNWESEKIIKNSVYCPLAWIHSFVNQNGNFQVCCTSEEFENNIRDENNNVININDNFSSEKIMNTDFMKKIRLEMLNGEWPELCKRCKITEDLGGISRRNVEIENYKNENKKIIEETGLDGSSNSPILSADYRLGNLCNLQCRMCNPRSTKLWIKEWNEVKRPPERFPEDVMKSYNEYHWIDSENLIDDFVQKAPTLTHIHFAGGEPLIVPQMKKVLEACIESGNSKNITITYNTNLTVLPKSVINLWKHFKGIKILASIDAVGDLNNYIRFPSDWNKIDENLKLIDQNHEEYNIQECMVSATVQILNILHLDELYKYLSQFNFIVPVPNLINLFMPHYFQTRNLPKNLKVISKIKLNHIKTKYEAQIPDHYKYLTDNISQIINFLVQDQIPDGIESFIEFQKKFDSNKNLDITKVLPEFKKYFSDQSSSLPFEG